MSRFATPSRTRPLVVAVSPSIPVQKEPGHRYANGIQLPGPSFKGRHVIEINVNGTRMVSPTRERPNTPERSTSPGGTIKDLQATHRVVSMADSHALPKPTTKPFVIPERTRRAGTPRSLTSSGLSDFDLTAGKSINTGRTTTPTRRLSRDFSVNSEVVSVSGPPRSSSAQSVRSSSNRSVSSAVSSISGTAYGSSVRSFSAGRNARSHSPIQYLTGGQHSSLNNASAHIHQSLASSKRIDNNHHQSGAHRNANKLELTQSAYRHFRKAVIRDAIHNFLQNEEDHRHQLDDMGVGDDEVDESLNDLLDMSIAGPPTGNPSPHRLRIHHHGESGDEGESGDDEDPNGTFDMNHTIMTSKMAMGKEDRRKFRRLHQMIKLLRQSIVDDLNLHGLTLQQPSTGGAASTASMHNLTPENLFFLSQHMHSVMVAQSRRELLDHIVQWRQQYTSTALSALDRYYASWVSARSQRLQAQRAYQDTLAQYKAQEQQKKALRREIQHYRQRAQELGLVLPKNLFPAELGLEELPDAQSTAGYTTTTLARSVSPSATMGTGQLRSSSGSIVSMGPNGRTQQQLPSQPPPPPPYDPAQSIFLSPKGFIQSSIRNLSQQHAQMQQPTSTTSSLSVQVPSGAMPSNTPVRSPAWNPSASGQQTSQIAPPPAPAPAPVAALPSPNIARGRFSYGGGSAGINPTQQQPQSQSQPQLQAQQQQQQQQQPSNVAPATPKAPAPSAAPNMLGEGKMAINLDVLRALNSPSSNAPVSLSASAAATANSATAPIPSPIAVHTPMRGGGHLHAGTSPTTAVRKHLSVQHQPNLHNLMYSPIHAQHGASQLVQPVYTQPPPNATNPVQPLTNTNTSSSAGSSVSSPPPPPPPATTTMSPLGMPGSRHMALQGQYPPGSFSNRATSVAAGSMTGSGASVVSALSTNNSTTAYSSYLAANSGNAALNAHLAVTKDPKVRARYATGGL